MSPEEDVESDSKKKKEKPFDLEIEEQCSPTSQPTTISPSQGTRSRKKKNVIVAFSGFKQSDTELKSQFEEIVTKLGGKVRNEAEFDINITHIVTPPNTRTIKTLAAVLSHRWLVNRQWLLDCQKEGNFIDEQSYGIRSMLTPFKDKKFFF